MTTGPYWGTDKRALPGVTAWLQNLATFKSQVPPPQFMLEFLGFRLNLPWRHNGKWGWFVLRVHLWRWDKYNQAYIFFSAMGKFDDTDQILP